MGFPVGVLIGVVLTGYVLNSLNHPNSHRSNASLTCPWLQETLPPGQPITVADKAPAQSAISAATRSLLR
jgi:hypothetical protein